MHTYNVLVYVYTYINIYSIYVEVSPKFYLLETG